jgi:hypothetical protein
MGPSRLDEWRRTGLTIILPFPSSWRADGSLSEPPWVVARWPNNIYLNHFSNYGDEGDSESDSQRIRFLVPTCNDRGAGFLDIPISRRARSTVVYIASCLAWHELPMASGFSSCRGGNGGVYSIVSSSNLMEL